MARIPLPEARARARAAEHWLLSDPGARDWVHRIYSLGSQRGSDLVEALGRPNPERRSGAGLSDNCALADRLLDWLVDNGWIEPVCYDPSICQRFFGVGGRAPGRNPRAPKWRASHTYPQEWTFHIGTSRAIGDYVRRRINPGR